MNVKVKSASAFIEKTDKNIVRKIDIKLTSGVVCRFDSYSFDGLQLYTFADQIGEGWNVDNQELITEEFEFRDNKDQFLV